MKWFSQYERVIAERRMKMKYFWTTALAIFCLSTFAYAERTHLCCDNDGNFMTNSSCPTATGARKRVSLTCGEKFTLDKFVHDTDEYQVLENGSLLVPDLELVLAYDQ